MFSSIKTDPGLPHSAHWGTFFARRDGADTLSITPHEQDPSPSPILQNFANAVRHRARVARPVARRGWLEHGPGPSDQRGREPLVALPWEEMLDRLAEELKRVRDRHGAEAVYGGSYGWASAGRFHHAQSQVHRFLNTALGGYVRSVGSYSAGAAEALLPHVMGRYEDVSRHNVTWDQVMEHSDTVLAFGGMALKNSNIAKGGVTRHIEAGAMQKAAARGAQFILISPLKSDFPPEARARWLPIRPNTDTALMLGLMHVLDTEELADRSFLESHCTGFETFAAYLRGTSDGQPKDAGWAATITGIDAETIRELARRAASSITLVTVAHALQRAEHGEQPVWAGVVLAAMLGQIGTPGGGYNYALGAMAHTGRRLNAVPLPTLSQGHNAVEAFIPCARVVDMLANPGAQFDYNGRTLTYPDIRLMYWAGGNPFHHHQDLNRLSDALARLDTFVVHESAWTASARHADIVLPATMTLEREDIGAAQTDPLLIAMRPVCEPYGEARDDYDIFKDLATRLDVEDSFTEGRSPEQWLRYLYEPTRAALYSAGYDAPDFDTFRARGELALPSQPDDGGRFRAFRADPLNAPLQTPTGRIEIHSDTIAAFAYNDCLGHPTWLEPEETPTVAAPFWLVANQPATRLHSQLDFAAYSQSKKSNGREVVRLHPQDARAHGIADNDIVRIFNARGACLAAASVTSNVAPGVLNLSTGAWYDPFVHDGQTLCVHGNPNVLTRDKGTSRLGQGSTGQLCCVDCEKWTGPLPPIRAYEPPG